MSPSYLDYILDKYSSRGILVDSNLLLLLLIGEIAPDRIQSVRRTKAYSKEDYFAVKKYVDSFFSIVTTPHILTEISNLLGQLPREAKEDIYLRTRHRISVLHENYSPARDIVKESYYQSVGLTDAAIIHLVPRKYPVMTDDLTLYSFLVRLGVDAININHFRVLFS